MGNRWKMTFDVNSGKTGNTVLENTQGVFSEGRRKHIEPNNHIINK